MKISHAVFSLTILLEDEIYWLTSTIHVNFSHLVIIKRIIIQQYGNKLCCISPKIDHCKCYCLVDLVNCIIESSIMYYLWFFLQSPLWWYHSQVILNLIKTPNHMHYFILYILKMVILMLLYPMLFDVYWWWYLDIYVDYTLMYDGGIGESILY